MGHIYQQHGRFAIEGRRESFYIHADYGLKPYECPLGDVKPGDWFRDLDKKTPYQVLAQLIDGRTTVKALSSLIGSGDRSSDHLVIPTEGPPNYDPIDLVECDHPLGSIWNEHPHPEIEIADLDDLIEALQSYRDSIGSADRTAA